MTNVGRAARNASVSTENVVGLFRLGGVGNALICGVDTMPPYVSPSISSEQAELAKLSISIENDE